MFLYGMETFFTYVKGIIAIVAILGDTPNIANLCLCLGD